MVRNMQTQKGFTIVELLIVIVVIGILAAITIVSYNGIQNRANDTSVRNDLSNLATSLAMYQVINEQYPADLLAAGLDIKINKTAYGNHYNNLHNIVYCHTATSFAVIARSVSGTTYAVTNTTDVHTTATALTTAATSCPDQGVTSTGAWWSLYNGVWRL